MCGTAGVKILGSKEARKVYAHTTAAVLRAKDCVLTKYDEIREGCGDILADAHDINEKKCAECDSCETIEDSCKEGSENSEEKDAE